MCGSTYRLYETLKSTSVVPAHNPEDVGVAHDDGEARDQKSEEEEGRFG